MIPNETETQEPATEPDGYTYVQDGGGFAFVNPEPAPAGYRPADATSTTWRGCGSVRELVSVEPRWHPCPWCGRGRSCDLETCDA